MRLLRLSIPGDPVGKGRPRVVRAGAFVRTFTPHKTAEWEAGAVWCLRQDWKQPPLDEPVALHVRAVASRPQRLRKKNSPPGRIWRTTKPDGDNVLKCVGDALVKAGVVVDDTRIVVQTVESLFAALDEGPCVEVILGAAGEWSGWIPATMPVAVG